MFERTLRRVADRAARLNDDTVSRERGEMHARQAASSLYHLTTAVAMAWEASRTRSVERMHLAQLVLMYRLLLQDPLAGDPDEPPWLMGLLEPETQPAPSDADTGSADLL